MSRYKPGINSYEEPFGPPFDPEKCTFLFFLLHFEVSGVILWWCIGAGCGEAGMCLRDLNTGDTVAADTRCIFHCLAVRIETIDSWDPVRWLEIFWHSRWTFH